MRTSNERRQPFWDWAQTQLLLAEVVEFEWWPGTESNRRRQPFQSLLPNWRSGLESADVNDGEELMP